MKHSIKFNLTGGVILFCLAMCLTSCEGALDDVLGEWSRPTPGNNTNNTPTADHSNQYLVYSYSTALDSVWTNIEGATEWNISTGDVAAGTYVVSSDFTCTGALVLKGDVNLIIKDGAKLTVNDGISYDPLATGGALNIYGQGISSSMGQLIVKNNTPIDIGGGTTEATAIYPKSLEIHGCLVKATGDTGATPADIGGKGMEGGTSLKIFNGKVVALGTGHGISTANGDLFIYGGDIDAQSSSTTGASAIYAYGDNLTIAGGIVKAAPTSAAANGVTGISADNAGMTSKITISGGKVTASGMEGIGTWVVNITGGIVVASNVGGGNPAISGYTSITISGTETQVTATGANGADSDNTTIPGGDGGIGINSLTIQIDGGTVIATGGNGGNGYTGGGDGGNGGDGINCTDIAVDASASVTATGGNGGNVKTGQPITAYTSMAGKGLNTANPATGTITATDGIAGTASL